MGLRGLWLILFLLVGCQSTLDGQGNVALRLYLGQQYLLLKELRNAERNFAKAIALSPEDYRGWWGLAQVAAERGESQQANVYYQHAFQKAPENAELINNYGAFLCALGQYDKVKRLFERGKQSVTVAVSSTSRWVTTHCERLLAAPSLAETRLEKLID